MSNLKKFKQIYAFHPGYYISEIIEEMEITQAEFAVRMGTTPKTVSKLTSGEIHLSNDLAKKLSCMTGTSITLWLNLQRIYNERMIEIEQEESLEEQNTILETQPFEAEKLKKYLPEIKSMTMQTPDIFHPRLYEIFHECGITYIFLPHLKNSGINGAVKWYGDGKVLLAMNNRRAFADVFWFSLFHEIGHVLQQKISMTFISGDESIEKMNISLEKEADEFAKSYLIPKKAFSKFIEGNKFNKDDILHFSSTIDLHPGIVVGRMQHEKIIPFNRLNELKQRIVLDSI